MKKVLLMAAAAFVASTLAAMAADKPEGAPRKHDGAGRPDGARFRPPMIAALDANSDGVIDADEIANASAALKKLDKNGDGKLTRDELMPPRPEGAPEGGARKGQRQGGDKPAE